MITKEQERELVDRLYAMTQVFETIIMQHPAVDNFREDTSKVRESLYSAYMDVGKKVMGKDKPST